MDRCAEAMSPSIMGIRKGETAAWPLAREDVLLARQGENPADTTAYQRRHTTPVHVVFLQVGLSKGLLGCNGGELGEAVRASRLLSVHVRLCVEPLYFCGYADVKAGGVKGGDAVNAGEAGFDSLPG